MTGCIKGRQLMRTLTRRPSSSTDKAVYVA
jgi:cell division protease FtsH